MALQVGQNFVQTPQITQFATATAAAATATAGGAQGAQAAGATGFGGQIQQILQTLQSLAAQLGQGQGAQTQGPFMPGAPNPADAGPAGQAQGGANAGAGAANARAFAGIGPDGKPYAFAEAGGNVAQAGAVPGGATAGSGAATGASSGGATAGAGAMSGDEKTITTKGGYKIESSGGGSWSITGPDGKKTDVHGDPHVSEADGGKWDFNKDASFVLGDGTKVNVKVDNLVSSKLEVTDGNQRAEIDAQTGKAGPLEQGPAKFDTAQNDQFVQGKDAEQWTKNGREIKGGGMDGNQELGDQVATAPGAANAGQAAGAPGQAQAPAQGGLQGIIDQIQGLLQQLGIPGAGANNAAQGAQAQPAAAQAPAAQAPAQQAAGQDPIQALTQQVQQLAQQLGGGAGAAQAPAAQAPAAQAPAAQQGGTQDAMGAITKMIEVLGQVLQLFQGLGQGGQKLAA